MCACSILRDFPGGGARILFGRVKGIFCVYSEDDVKTESNENEKQQNFPLCVLGKNR